MTTVLPGAPSLVNETCHHMAVLIHGYVTLGQIRQLQRFLEPKTLYCAQNSWPWLEDLTSHILGNAV